MGEPRETSKLDGEGAGEAVKAEVEPPQTPAQESKLLRWPHSG